MSRRSAFAKRARGSVDPILPLRGYVLAVGGSLLLLLVAAGWALPAPAPGRFAQSEPAMPPIRILSDEKRPERVVIDTNQLLPQPVEKEIATAALQPSLPNEPDATPATDAPAPGDDGVTSPLTSMPTQVRDSLLQTLPAHASEASHGHPTPPARRHSGARRGIGPRSAQHSDSFKLFGLN